MLFIDIENRKFLGYALDQNGLVKGDYDKLLDNLKTIHGLPGGQRVIKLKNGKFLHLADDKANIFLGKHKPNEIPGISGEVGTDDIIEELTILRNYSFADEGFELRPGSVHVLNIPSGNVTNGSNFDGWKTFFEDYNKDFLNLALQNPEKALLTLATYPHENLMFAWRGGQRLRNVRNNLLIPSSFAMEIKYLKGKGVNRVILKNGDTLDLNTIDIDNMNLDWTNWIY